MLKIAHISDVHWRSLKRHKEYKVVFEDLFLSLKENNPDMIFIGGDIVHIPNRPGEPKTTWANIEKIKKDLKWKPKVKFEIGVKKMLTNINDWELAPLWSPKTIKKATKDWFNYLEK